ncbi:MAG: peptide ligase PGM1-related protein [Acidobacteriota bacterium]|nr:peptide ligase PGM1-related protein [Acidobacteriota bacterium]
MIPKPPFASDLSLDDELAAFELLKPRLAQIWSALTASDDRSYTSVVVPSMTLDQSELRKLVGAPFYEERLLFLLIRLRNPKAHVVYVTSQPVHPLILDYYLTFMMGIPASHARKRLTMLCAHDSSPRPLTEKIIERPRLVERIRNAIVDPSEAYLTVFNSTPLERKLAVLLGIPLNGLDPRLQYLGTKSGSRKIFREAGVDLATGVEDVKTEADVIEAVLELRRRKPGVRRAVIKLNESFSGEGNALCAVPPGSRKEAVHRALQSLEFAVPTETPESYFSRLSAMGGVVEEFLEGRQKASPSAQLRTSPDGNVQLISTHDQILGGPSDQTYVGCSFPAHDDYRQRVQELALRIGRVLADHGVVSRFGIDFMATRQTRREPWRVTALEINLRVVGTTHPFLALSLLTGGELNPTSGLFYSLSGRAKYYKATDNLQSDAYCGLLPEDLMDILNTNHLHYNQRTESGVLFHLIGAVSEFGKLGVTAIANSPAEAQELYDGTLAVLAVETRYGREPRAPSSAPQ